MYKTRPALEVWELILRKLQDTMDPIAFQTWIIPCKPYRLTEMELFVLVENNFYKQVLEKRYSMLMESVYKQELGDSIKIRIINVNEACI